MGSRRLIDAMILALNGILNSGGDVTPPPVFNVSAYSNSLIDTWNAGAASGETTYTINNDVPGYGSVLNISLAHLPAAAADISFTGVASASINGIVFQDATGSVPVPPLIFRFADVYSIPGYITASDCLSTIASLTLIVPSYITSASISSINGSRGIPNSSNAFGNLACTNFTITNLYAQGDDAPNANAGADGISETGANAMTGGTNGTSPGMAGTDGMNGGAAADGTNGTNGDLGAPGAGGPAIVTLTDCTVSNLYIYGSQGGNGGAGGSGGSSSGGAGSNGGDGYYDSYGSTPSNGGRGGDGGSAGNGGSGGNGGNGGGGWNPGGVTCGFFTNVTIDWLWRKSYGGTGGPRGEAGLSYGGPGGLGGAGYFGGSPGSNGAMGASGMSGTAGLAGTNGTDYTIPISFMNVTTGHDDG